MAASDPAHGSLWTDAEFQSAIAAYGRMLRAEARGIPLQKSDVIGQLVSDLGRTKSSIDYRMRNISAVLDELGRDWIDGYKPMRNYPRRLRELIETEGSL